MKIYVLIAKEVMLLNLVFIMVFKDINVKIKSVEKLLIVIKIIHLDILKNLKRCGKNILKFLFKDYL